MDRRRFFPTKRVQQVPGRTVELELEIKPKVPGVVCPPGACECDVDGVAWFGDWYATNSMPEDTWRSGAYSAKGVAQGMYEPDSATWQLGGRLVSSYTDINAPGEAEVVLNLWRAVVLGRTLCDVQWTWSLNVPAFPPSEGFSPWWDGIEVTEQAGSLLVRVGDGAEYPWDGQPWWAELTATATCAGEAVGTLVLRPGFNLWNGDLPAIEP